MISASVWWRPKRAAARTLPAATERLVELHAVEEQLGAAVVRADAHREARALRIEQRQEVDLAAVVERLRAAERGFRGPGRRLQVFGTLALVAQRDERVLDVLERAHDAVFVAQHRLVLAASAISLIERVRRR
jgi:hypothetical protein